MLRGDKPILIPRHRSKTIVLTRCSPQERSTCEGGVLYLSGPDHSGRGVFYHTGDMAASPYNKMTRYRTYHPRIARSPENVV